MGLLKPGESLGGDRASMSDRAQLAMTRRSFIAAVASFTAMPFAASAQRGSDPAKQWVLMRGGLLGPDTHSLAAIEKILIEDPNILIRRDTLKYFLNEYQNNEGFIGSVEKVVMESPYQDVVQELFRFMVARKDHDLRFFIQMINMAASSNKTGLFVLASQSMEDVLTNDPDIFKDLSETDFIGSANSVYSDVTPQTAKKVFLSFLAADLVDSIAKVRFLQSNYWSSEDLAKIYNELNAFVKDHPHYPRADRINYLTGLIYDAILRDKALENIDEVFSLGPYEKLSGLFILRSDVASHNLIEKMASENRRFLTTSPRWRNMKGYIQPDLYIIAEKATKELIADNPAASPSGSPLYFYPQYQENSFLDYFNRLDINSQQEYISNSQSISELERILESQTPLREAALNRLMASADGRLLALKAYLESEYPQISGLIQSRDWMRTIRTDAQDIRGPAENVILRSAMVKMYHQTQEWPLNARLRTFSSLELHSAQDLRGETFIDAQINLVATQWALDYFKEEARYRPVWWAGYAVRSPEELTFLEGIAHRLKDTDDPRDFEAYLNSLQKNVRFKGLLAELMKIRDQYADRIKTNDQEIPSYLFLTKYFLYLGGGGLLFLLIKNLRHRMFLRKAGMPELITDVRAKLVGKEKKGEEEGDNGADKAVIAIPKRQVYSHVYMPLQTWRKLVVCWSKTDDYPVEDLVSDFNLILNNASRVIRAMPYSPELIWSNDPPVNQDFVLSYNYFILLAAQTLDVLSNHLKRQNAALSSDQRQRFLQDIKVMLGNMRYVSRYLRILKYRGTIERVMTYKFPDNDWSELYGRGPYVWARWILFYQPLLKISERNLKKELPLLLAEGNLLLPGLYEGADAIVQKSEQRLKEVIQEGKTAYNPLSLQEWAALKNRSFKSRIWALLVPVQIAASILFAAFGISELSVGSLILSVVSTFIVFF
jgi:hypothetical protein